MLAILAARPLVVIVMGAGLVALSFGVYYGDRAQRNLTAKGQRSWWMYTSLGWALGGREYFTETGLRYRKRQSLAVLIAAALFVTSFFLY